MDVKARSFTIKDEISHRKTALIHLEMKGKIHEANNSKNTVSNKSPNTKQTVKYNLTT